jgi:hypothetical protein
MYSELTSGLLEVFPPSSNGGGMFERWIMAIELVKLNFREEESGI